MIPVLIVDVTENEAQTILASHDPIATMAENNAEALEELLQDIETKSDALESMFEGMAADAGFAPPDFEPVSADEQGKLDERAKIECPKCGHEFEK